MCASQHHIGVVRRTRRVDAEIADLAGKQYGVVSRAQLATLGVSRSMLARRVDAGRLHRLHPSVFAVGHRVLSIEGEWVAAVLAAGPGARLTHRSAAMLWRIQKPHRGLIHVTLAEGTSRRGWGGVRVHRTRSLTFAEITTHRGIPTTSPARTLIDLAEIAPRRELEAALREARGLRLLDDPDLARAAAAHLGRRGHKLIHAILATGTDPPLTRSEMEVRFLELCAAHGIPRPRTNHLVLGRERDFVWPEHRLVAETDSWRWHGDRASFETDRRRDEELARLGYRTIRFTWRRIANEPAGVAATLGELLNPPARSAARGSR